MKTALVKDIKWLNNKAIVEFNDGSAVEHTCNFDRYTAVKKANDKTIAYYHHLSKTSRPHVVRTAYGH